MATKSIEAGKAFLRLLVEDTQFKRGLDQSLQKLSSFGQAATRLGTQIGAASAAVSAPFVGALKVFSDQGGRLFDLARSTGLTLAGTALVALADYFLLAGNNAEQYADQLDDVTSATQAATEATKELADATQKSIFARALERIEAEKNADAVQKEVDRIKALNEELRIHYRLQRERGTPLGTNPADPRLDPNLDNPFNDFAMQEFGRRLGERVGDLLGRFGGSAKPIPRVDEAALQTVRELRDTVVDQISAASREFRGGVGGRLAEQIAGGRAAEARETRALRLEEKQAELLRAMDDKLRQLLGRSGVLLVGPE